MKISDSCKYIPVLKTLCVLCFAAKFFGATNQVAMNPGNLKPNNVNISSEFNGTLL